MRLFRYATKHWATTFDGTGAKLYGGRYNPEGVAAIYCCLNPSLPYLECLAANLKRETWPRYFLTQFILDDRELATAEYQIEDLPSKWDDARHHANVQQWSASKLASVDALILPSRVNQLDRTVILNPSRQDFEDRIEIIAMRELTIDERLLRV